MLTEVEKVEERQVPIGLSRKESLPFSSYLFYQAVLFYLTSSMPAWRLEGA